MEDRSREIFRSHLLPEWVVRDYKPDYGIDLAVELFDYIDADHKKADALGENFLGQLKSVEKIEAKSVTVHPRYNVEKKPLAEDKSAAKEISVIPFTIDVGELLTVQAMSPALPVILFLIELGSKRVFFVCLNDLIDKVVFPADPQFHEKEHKTIWLPVENELTNLDDSLTPLRFYAKRPKLYAAFVKFSYQEHEMQHLTAYLRHVHFKDFTKTEEFHTIIHFLRGILRYDFWKTTPMWVPILDCHKRALQTLEILEKAVEDGGISKAVFPNIKQIPKSMQADEDFIVKTLLFGNLDATWGSLRNLANLHEEICREWFLPTFMAHDLSYYDA